MNQETITLPVEDVRRLCECNRELMEHLNAVDESCTASMYGREYTDKAWAKVASALPAKKGDAS